MTQLDLLESFDGTTAKIALVATYEFDPLFCERRVLRKRGFNAAERILVLMDAGRYREPFDHREASRERTRGRPDGKRLERSAAPD